MFNGDSSIICNTNRNTNFFSNLKGMCEIRVTNMWSIYVLQKDNRLFASFGKISWKLLDTENVSFALSATFDIHIWQLNVLGPEKAWDQLNISQCQLTKPSVIGHHLSTGVVQVSWTLTDLSTSLSSWCREISHHIPRQSLHSHSLLRLEWGFNSVILWPAAGLWRHTITHARTPVAASTVVLFLGSWRFYPDGDTASTRLIIILWPTFQSVLSFLPLHPKPSAGYRRRKHQAVVYDILPPAIAVIRITP